MLDFALSYATIATARNARVIGEPAAAAAAVEKMSDASGQKRFGFYFYPFFRTPQKFTREPSEFFHFADTFLSFSSSKVASAFAFSSVVMSR